MGISKVVLGEETLVDLTNDSVNEENLLEGATAHNASGEQIEGNVLVPTKISQLENDSGFLNDSSTVNFEQASQRINIQSSDSIKIILGKIKKWFNDLKPHAFLNPINNLLTTVSGSALDAMQGKVLDDKISALNESLEWKQIGTIQGTNVLTHDFTQYRELFFLCTITNGGTHFKQLPTIILTDSTRVYYTQLVVGASGEVSMAISISKTSLKIVVAKVNNADVLATSSLIVYGR